jgi:hypothetical protein
MKTRFFQSAVVLVGIFLSCIGVFADPLNNWHWRNPLPNGNPVAGPYNLYGMVFTNGQFFAVGASGIEATSTDGTNWIQSATGTANQLNDIIFANGQFLAVGNNGAVETSTDGTTWALQNSGVTNSLNSVAYGNGKYVAVGTNAIIASMDGVTWFSATSGPRHASQVAGSSSGFVALDGSTNAYFSLNGLTWTTNVLTVPLGAMDYGPVVASRVIFTKGTFLIAAYQSTPPFWAVYVFASSNGQNWTSNFVGTESDLSGFHYTFFFSGNGNAIAGGLSDAQFLLSSSDNVNWTYKSDVPGGIMMSFLVGNAGAYGNGLYVIVNSTSTIYTSTDNVNWGAPQLNVQSPIGPGSTFNSITYSNGTYVVATSNLFVISTNGLVYNVGSNTPSLSSVTTFGNSFVGVGTNGAIYQSSGGISWTQRVSGTANDLHCVAGGGSQLVVVGDGGVILTSPNGISWTSRTSHTLAPLSGVTYSNGLYVAVGNSGIILNSPDAVNWTLKVSGHTNALYAVTYGSAGFLAVGTAGIVLTSPDGANWTQQNAGTSATLESATFGNGYYLITGPGALVMTSPDGVNWTSRNVGATGGPTLNGSGFLNGRFDVVGSGGTILESDPVLPLFDLQMHATPNQNVFTLFAPPGSNFRIVSSSNLVGGPWSTVATFNNAAAITLWTNTVAGGNPTFLRLVSP